MARVASESRAEIPPVRAPSFPFETVPAIWFRASPGMTAALDAFNLVFPAGERFFIRSVKRFEARVTDPALRARMKGFYGQEAQHQRAHLEAAAQREALGLVAQPFLSWYERWAYQEIEPRFPPEMRLACTAACEHLTATLAEVALGTDILEEAAPAMRDLLRWHAIEEIEHRDVAFDVLQAIDPRLRTRLAGMALAVGFFAAFWAVGTRHFKRQQTAPPRRPTVAELGRMARTTWFVAASIADYGRRRFHPRQRPSDLLADRWRSTLFAPATPARTP